MLFSLLDRAELLLLWFNAQILKLLLSQTHHVETNETHDNHVELFVGNDRKYDGLGLPRRPRQRFDRLLRGGLLHGRDVLLLVLSHEGVE